MQTARFKTTTIWCALFVIVSAITSCKKDPVKTPAPQPANQELVVQFSSIGVPLATIDSVVAIVRDQNKDIKLWKTLAKGATALVKDMQLPLQQPVVLNAPTGTFTDTWYQRAIFFDGPEAVTIIVAMDPRDAYYEARFRQPSYTRIHLDRSSIDVNVLVAAKSKMRNIEGLVGFTENSDFSPYDIGFDYEYPNN
jgi:hypothetical protein